MKNNFILFFVLLIAGCSTKKNHLDLQEEFGTSRQVFIIHANRDTVLTGEQGTRIRIPAGIIPGNYSSQDTLKLLLSEYYSLSGMVLAGLSTTSNGRLIETNGMINIEMQVNSKRIDTLKRALDITFRNSEKLAGYSVFNGIISDHGINWAPDTITKNYYIYYNILLTGIKTDEDKGFISAKRDSLQWKNKYTKVDTIVTFEKSGDTIPYCLFFNLDSLTSGPYPTPIFRISSLGWINCDRFLEDSILTDIRVISNMKKASYFLVFSDISSIVENSIESGFSNVPVGRTVTLIGINKTRNQWFFGISKNLEIKKNGEIRLDLKETKKEEIEQQIRKIDK